MGLIERARGFIGGGTADVTRYRCNACAELFEPEPSVSPADLRCPVCGDRNVHEQ